MALAQRYETSARQFRVEGYEAERHDEENRRAERREIAR